MNDTSQAPDPRAANLLAAMVLGILAILIVPLPSFALDTLLSVNLAAAMLILLVAIRIERPLEFSVFPALLLIITLFRLGLNVATTRLILLSGGGGGAGHVIEAFGQFAVGGSVIVGAVVFLILLVVNFMVITKGSGRVSEVAARFTLDALPGKQMSIDADLAAGNIDDKTAKARREALSSETEFFGAMDGASKFVRGDAIAGLIITAINIVGGLLIGVIDHNMGFGQAVETFTILTIGDGLVSQIPALLISTAAGIVITRSGNGHLSRQLSGQLLGNPDALLNVAVVLGIVSLMPGMPTFAFLVLAGVAFALSRRAKNKIETAKAEEAAAGGPKAAAAKADAQDKPETIEETLALDTLELELGIGLVALIDERQGAELPGRVTQLRRQLAVELGVILPPVHLKDSLSLEAQSFRVKLRGVEIGSGQAWADRVMCLHPSGEEPDIDGISALEPAFGLPAKWIDEERRPEAEALLYTVVDPSSVMTTQLGELLRKHAHELVGRQETQELLDIVNEDAPKLVEETVPALISLGELARVLRGLLKEGVGVRDLKSILEAVADASVRSKETSWLVEQARLRLSRQITSRVVSEDGVVHAIVLDRHTESVLRQSLAAPDGEPIVAPDVDTARYLIDAIEREGGMLATLGRPCVLLAAPDLRRPLYSFFNRFLPDLSVVSARELSPGTQVDPAATLTLAASRAAA
jgi:flagellar biosynthesis protein FlhA